MGLPTSVSSKRSRPTLSKRFSAFDTAFAMKHFFTHIIGTFITQTTHRHPPIFPKVRPHAPNTILTPPREELSFWGRMGQSIWRLNRMFKGNNVKYAFKAGMATALLAAPAFFDATRPVFTDYRGEWALISVCPRLLQEGVTR